MSTAEVIFERAKGLPDGTSVGSFALCRVSASRCEPETEDKDWASFSTNQLLSVYGPADAVYDED